MKSTLIGTPNVCVDSISNDCFRMTARTDMNPAETDSLLQALVT